MYLMISKHLFTIDYSALLIHYSNRRTQITWKMWLGKSLLAFMYSHKSAVQCNAKIVWHRSWPWLAIGSSLKSTEQITYSGKKAKHNHCLLSWCVLYLLVTHVHWVPDIYSLPILYVLNRFLLIFLSMHNWASHCDRLQQWREHKLPKLMCTSWNITSLEGRKKSSTQH